MAQFQLTERTVLSGQPSNPPSPPAGADPQDDAAYGASTGRGRVLIVEDEYFVALNAEYALSDAGFAVVGHAATAEAAIHLAAVHCPDIVVMDIRLAGPRDGIDAAAEIHKTLGIPSLFASAHSDSDTRRRAKATQACIGWLAKPYSAAQLEAAVRDAVAGARRKG
jgi:DNA-binding NarL/FixJ family response regulator